MRLRTNFCLALISGIFVLVLIVLIIFIPVSRSIQQRSFQTKVLSYVRLLAYQAETPMLVSDFITLKELINQFLKETEGAAYALIADKDGKIVVHSFNRPLEGGFPKDLLALPKPDSEALITPLATEQGNLVDIAYPILNSRIGFVRLGVSEKEITRTSQLLLRTVFLIFLIGLGITFPFAYFLARLVTKSTERIVGSMDEVITGKKSRLSVKSPKELKFLQEKINELLEAREQVSERLSRVNEEIVKNQKWVYLGKLVAGLTHEINNSMDGVINCINTLRRDRLKKSDRSKYLELALDGAGRIEAMVKRLSGIIRTTPLKFEKIELNELIDKVLFFVDYRLSQNRIFLEKRLSPKLPIINGDRSALQQIFVNIIINAIDSMSQGGRLTVLTQENDGRVEVVISDTGKGIPKEIMSKIFDPFVTTKSENGGLGLGLSICQNLVELHNGQIEVKSQENIGATFTVSLPVE